MAAANVARRPGRRIARRFYERALTEAERADFRAALEIDDIDEEIALLRVRLLEAVRERPDDLQLMLQGIQLLARAVATRYRLSKKSEEDLSETLANVLSGFSDMLGEDEGV